MESGAMTVVLRCQSPDGEFQARPGGSRPGFGSATFSEPAGECSKVVVIGGCSDPWLSGR